MGLFARPLLKWRQPRKATRHIRNVERRNSPFRSSTIVAAVTFMLFMVLWHLLPPRITLNRALLVAIVGSFTMGVFRLLMHHVPVTIKVYDNSIMIEDPVFSMLDLSQIECAGILRNVKGADISLLMLKPKLGRVRAIGLAPELAVEDLEVFFGEKGIPLSINDWDPNQGMKLT